MKARSVSRFPAIAIMGAGFGGLCMAAELKRAGIDSFTIFEKEGDVGGIWRDNTYPGCGCDVPSHLYSFSFEKYRDVALRYPEQREILAYLQHVTDSYDLRGHLRTGAGIASADYSESTGRWVVRTTSGETHIFDIVISAVGQLHRPKLPDIPGRDDFKGESFHTAKWNHDYDLSGRDVAVIGTGSSGAQLLSHVARVARRVDVYQRTPNWVVPKPRTEFGPVTRWAFTRLPFTQNIYRALNYLAADLALSPIIARGWSARPAEWVARRHLRKQIRDPLLRAKLTPDYPIGCKRILIDNTFYPTLNRANVELVTDGISRITPTGIVTADGEHRDVDAVIYATGFRTTEFLVPMRVRGRGGVSLDERWADGAEAYLGMALPEFPNLFFVHGPNTILGHNSNIFMIECQVRYVLSCLRLLPGGGLLEVRPEAMRDYQRWLEKAISRTVWPTGCQSWYKTASGRVTNPWPASTMRYRKLTRRDPADAFRVLTP
ncbi:NAD(P)/FAD-dependent oxidoreductase [Allokutzneria sp. A3M-2-11 16]|uniref:flavin-containing monooxygenase n=1 Tax=Allokutzneria sp. A3M-2-11 16 TaxID=2962043 RepID=UPI0020B69763|nr:NAD(P)/FAD-dependent oxidoreductase [Allokutzneria sp. A3M-2-11 16]MCP3804864.1 NAD(P)/FAD-dependent oxidoreductase [Allokutzneria sp. A3M-2-11 16]